MNWVDILVVVLLSLLVVGLLAYFLIRKARGKSLTGCDCASGKGKAIVKAYHAVEHGRERAPQLGQGVFHLGRDDGIDLPGDEAVFFHRAELLGQHFLGDGRQGALQFRKAFRPPEEIANDEDLPFIRNEEESRLDGAGREFAFVDHVFEFLRGTFFPDCGRIAEVI